MAAMGFVLDFLAIVGIVVPIAAPVLLTMEAAPGVLMSPVGLGVMMAMNLQTSFSSPVFSLVRFDRRDIAPAGPSRFPSRAHAR